MFSLKELIIFCIITTYSPGPNTLLSMICGMRHGFKKSLSFLSGIYLGFICLNVIVIFLSNIIRDLLPQFDNILKIVGVVYLIYLAYKISFSKKKSVDQNRTFSFKDGFLLQFLNVKVMIYSLTASGAYVLPYFSNPFMLIGFAILMASVPMIANLLWNICGGLLQNVYDRYQKYINLIFSIGLLYAAFKIAMS